MNRSLQCIRGDCDECIGCDCTCHPVEQTWEHFVALTRQYAEMMQHAESRTDRIMKRMKHRGGLKKADEYGAVIEYNNACHCHPTWREFTIPAEWLFAEDWEAKVDEYVQKLEAKRLAAEAEISQQRLAMMKPIDQLRESLGNGTFHHATYRNIGTVWEGLWFYVKDASGFRGFSVAGCVNKTDPDIEVAHELVRGTGMSVGSYGNG